MSKIVREIEAMQAPSLNAHDTVSMPTEVLSRIIKALEPERTAARERDACIGLLKAALAAPQPDIIPQESLFVCGQMGANVTKVYAEPQPGKPQIEVGPKLFSFRSRVDWSNKASKKWKAHGLTAQKTLCIDQKGRVCGWGEHFITAEDESAYPIDVYLLRADMAPEIEGAKP